MKNCNSDVILYQLVFFWLLWFLSQNWLVLDSIGTGFRFLLDEINVSLDELVSASF
jgi:hypothetical protein